jgi:hypothetical protein
VILPCSIVLICPDAVSTHLTFITTTSQADLLRLFEVNSPFAPVLVVCVGIVILLMTIPTYAPIQPVTRFFGSVVLVVTLLWTSFLYCF